MQFELGEPMVLTLTRDAGLFFLDVETGAVEGWTACANPAPSAGNRFVLLDAPSGVRLYDRQQERTYTWDAAELSPVRSASWWYDRTSSLLGWGTGPGEHLVFREGSRYAVVNASMEAVAWFEFEDEREDNPPTVLWLAHPGGEYVVRHAREDGALASIDLVNGGQTAIEIPESLTYAPQTQVHVLSGGEGVAVVSHESESGTCTVTRLGWDLGILSEASMQCSQTFGSLIGAELSPDGTLIATVTFLLGDEADDSGWRSKLAVTSIHDAVTGEELVRVHGALPSRDGFGIHDGRQSRWLADSSGLVLATKTDERVLNMDGSWGATFIRSEADPYRPRGSVIPSRDDPDRFDRPLHVLYQHCEPDAAADRDGCRMLSARVTSAEGELATAQLVLEAIPGAAWRGGPGWTRGVFSGAYNRTSWGLSSRELRVHLASGGPYEGGGYSPLQEPRVERPPFFDATTLTVAASDSCRHLRERFDAEAASLACLPSETVVESVKPVRLPAGRSSHLTWSYGYWIHVRTEEGLQGWMHSDDLVGWQP